MYNSLVFLFVCVVFSAFRGIIEGMIMQKRGVDEGIRGHKFFRYYHALCIMRGISGFGVGAALITLFIPFHFYYLSFILFSFLVCWQVFEVAYLWSRYDGRTPADENFLGLDIYIDSDIAEAVRIILIVLSALLWVYLCPAL